MYVQKGINLEGKTIWIVLGDDYAPVEPIQQYLNHLFNRELSPNTIQSYARYLKLYWEYLTQQNLDWRNISIEDLSNYIHWLRVGGKSDVISLQPQTAIRSEKTVNHAMTAVHTFYEFHTHLGTVGNDKRFTRFNIPIGGRYKSFLAGIAKAKPRRTSLLRLKEPKKFPGCLTPEQVKLLVNGCNRLRDKLIILMLYETGMRKGELLGLRHEDMGDFGENEIRVVARVNINGARAKSGDRTIAVSRELMQLYNEYLIREYPDVDSDYVFVNCWSGKIGHPMNYKSLNQLFKQLEKKTGVHAYPHLLRHTHATELLLSGIDIYHVSKRLGHTSVNTTIDTYGHLSDKDLQTVIEKDSQE